MLLTLFLFTAGVVLAQKTITGKVSDGKGDPVPNASVTVKASSTGTVTKDDGTYSISVPSTAKTLVFSIVGAPAKEVAIGSGTIINVTLDITDKALEEVVVVAYGTQTKAAFTGSAATVKGDVLENRPVTSFEKALQGQASGITVQAASGQPGGASTVRIRGVGSFSASSAPLYVLDGVPISAEDLTQSAQTASVLSAIDPRDIESVTVLKDATAAGLYGSRAANGVIVITTKKGKAGKSSINFSANNGFSSIAVNRHDVMSGTEYFKYFWDYYYQTRITAGDNPATAATFANDQTMDRLGLGARNGRPNMYNTYQPYNANGELNAGVVQYYDTDWRDAVLRQGRTQDYSISLSGGNDKTRFYLSGGYFEQKGITIASDFKRYATKLNLENSATSFMKVGVNTTLAYTEQNTPPGAGGAANPIRFAELVSGVYPLYALDAQGVPVPDPSGNGLSYFYRTPVVLNYNPVGLSKKDIYNAKTVRGILSPYIDINIYKGLKFKTQGTIDFIDILETQYYNPVSGDGAAVGGRTYKFRPRDMTLTLTNMLSYTKGFGQSNIELLAGQEAVKFRYENVYAHGTTFPFDGIVELASSATPVDAYSNILERRISSLFGRVNYDLGNKYFLTAGIRRDGSSVFGKDEKYGNFWNAGAGWRLGQESFMKDITWINELKLKGSYGTSGNASIGEYANLGLYGLGYNYGGVPGMTYSQLENPNLRWEQNAVMDLGLEAELFKKIRLEFTYFSRQSKDVLFAQPLSQLTGFTSITTNLASLKNSGIEAMVEATIIDKKDFRWVSSVNITHTKNVIEKMNVDSLLNGNQLWKKGMDRYQWFLREWAGVDPADGAPMWYIDEVVGGVPTGKKITTKNWNNATRYKNGSALPKLFGGFNNTLTYKSFDLNILTFFSIGGKIYDNALAQQMHGGTSPGSQLATQAFDAWKKPGDVTDVPRFMPNNTDLGASASTRFLFDGSYLRLKNVSLGYNVSPTLLSRFRISNARLFISGENLATWAKHKGMDPEVSIGGTANNEIPIIKTISVGLNIGL